MAARSGRRGSKNGSGWSTRISETPRHSRGVRSRVQTTIEMTRTTSPALNHGERKMAKRRERSSTSTTPGAQDRVVSGVEVVERRGVVGRRAEGEVRQLPDRHPDDREQRQDDDLGDREVDPGQEVARGRDPAGRRGWGGRAGGGRRNGSRGRDVPGPLDRARRAAGRDGRAAGPGGVPSGSEGGAEVVLEVFEILEPDRDAEQPRGDPGLGQLGLAQLPMRGRRRMDDHRVDAAERRGQLRHLQAHR